MSSTSCMRVVLVSAVLAFGVPGLAAAQAELPQGEAAWTLEGAHREATPTREHVSLGGLWQWQPAGEALDTVPTDGWGYLRVPTPWPSGRDSRRRGENFLPNPAWSADQLRDVTAAWYQVTVPIPAEWEGRRIALSAEFLNSFATVYVDGRKVGDMQFPAGELDLTAVCRPGGQHVVSMLVLAVPLRAVMLAFNDTDAAREVAGTVARRGLCGDVCLVAAPRGARVGPMRVETSVREGRITFDTMLHDVDPAGAYRLRAEVRDGDEVVREFTSEPFGGADAADGRIRVTHDWLPDKLWDIHTPQNQYDVTVSLLNGAGDVLDEALPDRFGFREFRIDGRYFYLNGTRIFLTFERGQPGWTYEGARETLEARKSLGIAFGAVGGFGCAPGDHMSLDGVLRAADDVGVLIALTQPHFRQYEWRAEDSEQTNGYARHAEFYTRVAGNHPSVVSYATSHNGTGYADDMNPDMIDGIQSSRSSGGERNARNALRAEAVIRGFDSSRIVYHHSSGNLGSMHTSNFYSNWAPPQEMSDWFEHWATEGVKPVHLCEYGSPLGWDWTMYRGYYKGERAYGGASVPWEFCQAEWNAQFYGPEAYELSETEAANIRWEADKLRRGEVWKRWDYPHILNWPHPEKDRVFATYVTDNMRAFRTWGVSSYDPCTFQGPLSREALLRNNGPVLAYIGGRPGAFTSKDHNFLAGETVEKQLIVLNNSRETVTAECEWTFALPSPVRGRRTVTLPTGEQERIPLSFDLPAGLVPGQYALTANVRFDTGEVQDDAFAVDVVPAPRAVRVGGRVAVFDPQGETSDLLNDMEVAFDVVDADADLAPYDVLVIGKNALTLGDAAPGLDRVRDGLKVLIFEQTGDVLEKRFGFRVTEYGLRWVYKRLPDHPVLAGVGDGHLRNWRGEATAVPPRIDFVRSPYYIEWCGIRVPRVWRCGNRGNVATALIEKPAVGDFLPILDGGFSLQYASLMEYREGQGMVLFCQTDVTGRTESDPVAETLAGNIVRYVSEWQPSARRTVVYAGEEAGRAHLEAAGISPAAFTGPLSADQVLVLGPGAMADLGNRVAAVRQWALAGGRVLALGLTGDEASGLLPQPVVTRPGEHMHSYFDAVGVDSPLAGVSPADVHNRDPRELPLVTGGATPLGNGVLAHVGPNVVFCQLPPWQLDYSGEKMNVKRTFRKFSYTATRLLANMGASGRTPMLAHISQPVGEGEQRWLDGLYLDVPEEWDDPYRFFRW
ncbi:MAG: hypothetical protein GXY85_11395 [Candidatus Brocadiaceae bacterium]|nr:hypothetical protein [Candidatus Brocadiaceae bacterium]